jgi:hypothetical protein
MLPVYSALPEHITLGHMLCNLSILVHNRLGLKIKQIKNKNRTEQQTKGKSKNKLIKK